MNCTVVKVGGKLVENETALQGLCDRLLGVPQPLIVVHGGGKLAGELCRRLEIPERMVAGRRITDEETLKVAVMTYAGWINKALVSTMQRKGMNACGLSGCDMQVVTARKRLRSDVDWGYVGDIESVNTTVLSLLLREGVTPVLSPITYGIDGYVLNTNADSVAAAVAEAMAVHDTVDLVYCFDKKGVLKDTEDESSVIPRLTKSLYESYREEGIIHSGMIPKLDHAFASLNRGVRSVRLVSPDELGRTDAGTLICP